MVRCSDADVVGQMKMVVAVVVVVVMLATVESMVGALAMPVVSAPMQLQMVATDVEWMEMRLMVGSAAAAVVAVLPLASSSVGTVGSPNQY